MNKKLYIFMIDHLMKFQYLLINFMNKNYSMKMNMYQWYNIINKENNNIQKNII